MQRFNRQLKLQPEDIRVKTDARLQETGVEVLVDRPDMNPHAISRRVTRNHRVIVSKHFAGAFHCRAFHCQATTDSEAWPAKTTNRRHATFISISFLARNADVKCYVLTDREATLNCYLLHLCL